jgi:hypothetical protein
MANYKERSTVGGKWAKAAEIKNGIRAKIVSETKPQPSTFLNKDGSAKTQDVAKVQFEGMGEALNVSLNSATINGLVRAFGEDSKAWQGQYLSVETEKMRVAGKAVTALYLIPEGFKRIDDENGYALIVKEGEDASNIPPLEDEEIKPEEIPF